MTAVLVGKLREGGMLVKNVACDASVFVGAVVRVQGSICVNAQADNFANSRAVGVVIAKPTATTANVILGGTTTEVFTGLDTSKDYFLSESTPGQIQAGTYPDNTDEVILFIGRPLSDKILNVNISEGIELDES